jgi:hypothetical protein
MSANVTFSVRGNSLSARYAPGGAANGNINGVGLVSSAGTGVIGGSYIDMSSSFATKGLYYAAQGNFPATAKRKFSVLLRAALLGVGGSEYGLWALDFGQQIGTCGFGFQSNFVFQVIESVTSIADIGSNNNAWTPTRGQFYDIVCTFDASNSTNPSGLQIFIDGVLLNFNNLIGTWPNAVRDLIGFNIALGTNIFGGGTQMQVNEFVIWDDIIDPTNVILDSGPGSLNGQSRTSFVAAAAFDGSIYTDPGIANVRSGINYIQAGVNLTGTLVPSTGSRGRFVNAGS